MSRNHAEEGAFDRKLNAQLLEIKTKFGELEAHANGSASETDLCAIRELRKLRAMVEKKREELKVAEGEKVDEIKGSIEAGILKVRAEVDRLQKRIRSS